MNPLSIEQLSGQAEHVRVLRITGALTIQSLFELQTLLRSETSPITIVDISAVPYMDSAALGTLLGFHVSCQKDGRKYAVVGVSPRIQTLLEVCHVHDFLVCCPTVEDAEATLAGKAAKA